jgi:hypothetical protein
MFQEVRNQLKEDAYRYDSPTTDIEALVIPINEENLSCANIADGLFEHINQYKDDYKIFIVDFSGVKQASEAFFYKYIKYCLSTKLKVFHFNMSILVESAWSICVENFFTLYEEETEED